MPSPAMWVGVAVTIAIFMATTIFAAGRLSSRVDKLEEWRTESRDSFAALDAKVDRVITLLLDRTR